MGSSEATRRRQARGLLFVCCGRKDEEEGTQGGARARWIGEKEEVGWVDQIGKTPRRIWKTAVGDGTHLLDFRVCPKRLGVEYIYITD